MHRLEVTLKQHTPLIHFQHDQEGATLRASEVKPKLDRFIIKQCFDDNFESCKEYLIGYNPLKPDALHNKFTQGFRALNYKLKIETFKEDKLDTEPIATFNERRGKFDQFPLMLINMGKESEEELIDFIMYKKVILHFFSVKSNIIDQMKNILCDFLSVHNFGNRQSKGFGSFYVDSSEDKNEIYKAPNLRYKFKVSGGNQEPFKSIELFYKSIRSGINDQGFYLKPYLFKYAKDILHLQWDKKTIKENLLNRELKNQQSDHPDSDTLHYDQLVDPNRAIDEKFLIKELLGLSTVEQWGYYDMELTRTSNNVKRFKSPIIFKPIKSGNDYDVYFDAFEIPEDIKLKNFEISGGGHSFPIRTTDQFSARQFLEYIYLNKSLLSSLFSCTTTDDKKIKKVNDRFNKLQAIINSITLCINT